MHEVRKIEEYGDIENIAPYLSIKEKYVTEEETLGRETRGSYGEWKNFRKESSASSPCFAPSINPISTPTLPDGATPRRPGARPS
ncbi:hypothetical protein E2C01_057170 [Portunus trituberculatus]|uniref:Uncharacterized protein n=1 Tax=Portunus trituberculatus TaxID=210409 RepID=A0A5B7H143_PORTR|nr:hypothetical protein [Portunus trituberculatus]